MDPIQELRPGRFSDRFLAYLLDTIPFAVAAVVSVWLWGGPLSRAVTLSAMSAIGALWVGLAVVWQFAGNLAGGTPGKRLMGLRVVAADGEPPGLARAAVRAIGWVLSTPLANAGFLVALFHPRTRALHDLLAGTYVVEEGPRRSNGAAAFLLAALMAVALFALQFGANLARPSREDLAAIAKTREGVEIIARIQEEYKVRHGVYADSVEGLAEASGNPEVFRAALLEVFAPEPFKIEAGNRRWRLTAAAKDRRRTRIVREGP